IVTDRKIEITAWSAGVPSRLASNHGLHGFFIQFTVPACWWSRSVASSSKRMIAISARTFTLQRPRLPVLANRRFVI
ncbi:hypothetical protein, partial [Neorhodopirellula lusitana]|uniref:hypothetical protein n=1 Tax=Neorhodopirellula lusitana TaxID=445327 RepID=UPI0024B642DE